MAYTFGNSARLPATATTTNANPATFTINCPANTKVLWLGIVVGGTTARAGGSPTYNGVAMTAGVAKTNAGGTAETNAETWYMLNPPTGSSLTISVPNSGTLAMTLMAATGVNTAVGNPSSAGGTATPGSSTNPTGNSSTGAVGDIIFGRVGDGATTWNPSGRTGTQIYDWDAGTWGGGSQYIIAGTTAAVAVGWTMNVNEDWIVETDRFTFTVTQNDLTADDLSSGTPTLTTPAIGQIHVLNAADLSSGTPMLTVATLAQVHALFGDDITTGVPTLTVPNLAEQASDDLTADDLDAGTPTLTSPAIGQIHALTADDITAGVPELTMPTIAESSGVDVLLADDIEAGAPILDTPALAEQVVSIPIPQRLRLGGMAILVDEDRPRAKPRRLHQDEQDMIEILAALAPVIAAQQSGRGLP